MNKFQIIATGLLLYIGVQACKKDTTSTISCTGVTPTYTTDIKPIYDSYCATSGCHSSSSGAAGIKLNSYANSIAASDSRILGSVQHSSGYNAMPQGSAKLSDTQIQKIYCWIQNGKPQ